MLKAWVIFSESDAPQRLQPAGTPPVIIIAAATVFLKHGRRRKALRKFNVNSSNSNNGNISNIDQTNKENNILWMNLVA